MNDRLEAADPGMKDLVLPDQPYPGLRPFTGQEWVIFFGRESMTQDVVSRLAFHRKRHRQHGTTGGPDDLFRRAAEEYFVHAADLPTITSHHDEVHLLQTSQPRDLCKGRSSSSCV